MYDQLLEMSSQDSVAMGLYWVGIFGQVVLLPCRVGQGQLLCSGGSKEVRLMCETSYFDTDLGRFH